MHPKVKSYFDAELVAALLFSVAGFVIGYASFLINNSGLAFFLMLVAGTIVYFGFKAVMKIKQDRRWWISNAFAVYALVWLISWTIFYNLVLR